MGLVTISGEAKEGVIIGGGKQETGGGKKAFGHQKYKEKDQMISGAVKPMEIHKSREFAG